MIVTKIIETSYKSCVKPIAFKMDAEDVHDKAANLSLKLGSKEFDKNVVKKIFNFESKALNVKTQGLSFENPIGLAAGFDYEGMFANILPSLSFGFNTVGTVTAKRYEGNKKPRLGRLPKSKSLYVNKGFKSSGANNVFDFLSENYNGNSVLGISVGSSNLPEVDTIQKAVEDYLYTFKKFMPLDFVKYFELNISCPNTTLTESFTTLNNYESLLSNVTSLQVNKPIFVKMPCEMEYSKIKDLIDMSLKYNISGFIFSNLVKKRTNPGFVKEELDKFYDSPGNFSGKPTFELSNQLIKQAKKDFGNEITIVGCGGVFSAQDAYEKIKNGADLVQLITGMIFEGPQLVSNINRGLVKLIQKDGYDSIRDAVGINLK